MAGRLAGHVAVVTGSESGIGQATAVAFAQEGADVAVTYLHDREGAEKTRRAVEEAGRRAAVYRLDQREPEEVAGLFKSVRRDLGVPNILVNNAGIDASGKYVKDLTLEEWDNAIRTNLYGPFYCCKHFVQGLHGSGKHGTILDITSVHQEIPRPGGADYNCAKGGLRNLTTTLALELAEQNINVNNIAPGMVLTPFNQPAIDNPQIREEQVQSIPMKRAAEPAEIAKAAVFLASEDARYVHGTTLVVDGGLMLFRGQGT